MNVHTEEEAKEKWCPHSRVFVAGYPDATQSVSSHNRIVFQQDGNSDVVIPPDALCIGSACMMWRFDTVAHGGGKVGYCGLAGAVK